MKHHRKYQLVLIATVILVACASISSAQIELRFTPPDTTIAPNDATRISVMLDDAVFFRTIELTVTYDPTYISTDVAGPGDLFDDPSLFVWTDFVEEVPGQWYGVAVIMGATDSLSGPGELYAWEVISGPDEGTTPITAIDVKLYAPNALIIPDVTLNPTTLRVRIPPSAVDDLPAFKTDLGIYPNPFNPSTRIGFDLPVDGQVLLAVFDSRGRRVTTLHEGPAAAGPQHFDWDGRDDRGFLQPGGVYLFRLQSRLDGATNTATTKGLLLK